MKTSLMRGWIAERNLQAPSATLPISFKPQAPTSRIDPERRRVFGQQHISVAWHAAFNVGRSTLDVQRWTFNVLRLTFHVPRLALCLCLLLSGLTHLQAYPPAPPHTLFGSVRNQWGDPIDVTGAQVFVETTNGVGKIAFIAATTEPGVNYRMRVPMDSGSTLDLYQSTALFERQMFQLKVQIGTTTYLPLEMALGSPELGQPGGGTRLDLTLGEDADGDGLPDGWERAIIALLGGTLESITPDGDADGDGLSNLEEYLAGTYAFDPNEGFALSLVGVNAANALLEFLAIRGRTYSILSSADLEIWTPVQFRIVDEGSQAPLRDDFLATELRQLRVELPFETGAESSRYFKAIVQ